MCSYTVLQVTPALLDAVKLARELQGTDKVLVKELSQWLEGERETISFDLVKRVHHQLQESPDGGSYLHELLLGSSIVLPQYVSPPRNPELVARLEKIKARVEEKEYKRMVKDVDRESSLATAAQFGLEMSTMSQQMWTMVNFLFTVIGSFVFGYCAAYYASLDATICVFVGLGFGVVVFLADLYFLVRVPVIAKEKTKTKEFIKESPKSTQ